MHIIIPKKPECNDILRYKYTVMLRMYLFEQVSHRGLWCSQTCCEMLDSELQSDPAKQTPPTDIETTSQKIPRKK